MVRFGNNYFAAIIGYGDLQMGNILISRVYYVEGIGHNLFSVGQFCDSDLKVAFRIHTCFVRNLEGVDLLFWIHGPELYGFTSRHISSGIMLNQAASTSAKPLTKNDWDLLFQPMASSSSSFINKDAPSPSTSPNIEATISLINSTDVELHEEVVEFDSFTSRRGETTVERISCYNVARIEAIIIFLSYIAHKNMVVFQMDVKTASQPEGWVVNQDHSNHVFKLKKAFYGLKQALHVCMQSITPEELKHLAESDEE
ncbi:retrovirus-related pol polyprotein from transposon TNT 1-94 [Tanacetum coccineum]